MTSVVESFLIHLLEENMPARRRVRGHRFKNNSAGVEVNWGPLSETRHLGNPNHANGALKTPMVFSAVVLSIGSTSNQLEWLSTSTKNMDPIKARQSTCTLSKGVAGNGWWPIPNKLTGKTTANDILNRFSWVQ